MTGQWTLLLDLDNLDVTVIALLVVHYPSNRTPSIGMMNLITELQSWLLMPTHRCMLMEMKHLCHCCHIHDTNIHLKLQFSLITCMVSIIHSRAYASCSYCAEAKTCAF